MTVNSIIKVNGIESFDPVGPVTVSYGATIPSGQTFTARGGVSISGVVTATNFVGDGSDLTDLTIATVQKTIAYTIIR